MTKAVAAARATAVRAVIIKFKNVYLKAVCDNVSRIALSVFEFMDNKSKYSEISPIGADSDS